MADKTNKGVIDRAIDESIAKQTNELMLKTFAIDGFATSKALVKLLIQKGIITEEEFIEAYNIESTEGQASDYIKATKDVANEIAELQAMANEGKYGEIFSMSMTACMNKSNTMFGDAPKNPFA